jgi:hypothetical protein
VIATRGRGPGHPPTGTVRLVVALRRFLREGTPWRSLVHRHRQMVQGEVGQSLAPPSAAWYGLGRHSVHSLVPAP